MSNSSGSINVIVDELKNTMTLIVNRIMSTLMNQLMVISITIMICFYVTYNEIKPFEYNKDIFNSFYDYKLPTEDEAVLRFRDKFKNFDDMDIITSFMYVFKSSYLICSNHIKQLNYILYGFITFNPTKYFFPQMGVLITYLLIIIAIYLNTMSISSIIKYILSLVGAKSGKYVVDILYNLSSSFIVMFNIYFITSCLVYMTYLLGGFFSITSENASNLLRFFYIAGCIFPILIMLNLSFLKEGIDLPQCNNNSSMLGYLMFIFIIPLLASAERIFLLMARGIGGIPQFFTGFSTDERKQGLLSSILGYGLLILLIFTVWPLVAYMLIPSLLSALNATGPLNLYNSWIR